MLLHPLLPVVVVLVLAALCFALGTLRGSWRVWLVGYALTVLALALAFGGVRSARRAALAADAERAAAPMAAPTADTAARGLPGGPGHPRTPASPRPESRP